MKHTAPHRTRQHWYLLHCTFVLVRCGSIPFRNNPPFPDVPLRSSQSIGSYNTPFICSPQELSLYLPQTQIYQFLRSTASSHSPPLPIAKHGDTTSVWRQHRGCFSCGHKLPPSLPPHPTPQSLTVYCPCDPCSFPAP